jgi:hypothetical protein
MMLMSDDRCDLLCLDLEKAERLRVERLDGERAVRLAAMPGRWLTRRG